MNAQNNPLFQDFEVAEGAGFEITFGLPVVEIVAEVKAMVENGTTVRDLVARFKAQLGLPENVIVFVDGNLFAADTAIPTDASRVEIVKAAGAKGAATLANTPIIPLDPADCVTIKHVRQDTLVYIIHVPFEEGKVSISLEAHVKKMGLEVLSRGKVYLTVGHIEKHQLTHRPNQVVTDVAKRRVSGGIAPMEPFTIADAIKGLDQPVWTEVDGKPYENWHELVAGETLFIIQAGNSVEVDYTGIFKRVNELMNMSWLKLRTLGASKGIKVAGKGRDSKSIMVETLRAEFLEIPTEELAFRLFVIAAGWNL